MGRVEKAGLRVDETLAAFINERALPGSGVEPRRFWEGLSMLIHEFGPRNRALLDRRDELQSAIDGWHIAHRAEPKDTGAYRDFLAEIGYLVPEGEDFQIETPETDPEFSSIAGPQLVVPITNARYALNAANARWGSLYDALYGTDALGDLPQGRGYDAARAPASLPGAVISSIRPRRWPRVPGPRLRGCRSRMARWSRRCAKGPSSPAIAARPKSRPTSS